MGMICDWDGEMYNIIVETLRVYQPGIDIFMSFSKRLWRSLLFIMLISALCGGLVMPMHAPARAAPQMQAAALSVVINEIGWSGTQAGATAEWIELYNPGLADIPLNGWTLRAIDGTPNITLTGTIV